jgi:hypothetical protein
VADVPEGFDEWFSRAVERDPERRFQTARELREALRPILGPGAKRSWVGPLDGDTRPMRPRPATTLHVPTYPSPSPVPDPRPDPRFPPAIPTGIDGKRDLRHAALLCDASAGGAVLLTRHPFRVGQALVLSLHLDSAEHGDPLQAQVTQVEQHTQAVWKYRVGVRFTAPLSEELRTRLEMKARERQLGAPEG